MEKPASVCLSGCSGIHQSPAVVCVTRGRELPLERAHQCSRDALGRDLPPPGWEKPQMRDPLDLEALGPALAEPSTAISPQGDMAHGGSLGFV